MIWDIDLLFQRGQFLRPDMLFVPTLALPGLRERGAESAPDLVVEVVSPSSGSVDRGKKAARYRDFGVPEYWVVDPVGRTIEVYRPKLDGPEVHSERIRWQPDRDTPALEIDLPGLFRD